MMPIQNSASTHQGTTFPDNSHIINYIFSHLNARELTTCLLVCKHWNQHANNEALWNNLVPDMAFGPKQWEFYIGNIGVAPPLPRVIHKLLNAPCPIWPGKGVHETHLLTLIPQTVNGKPLTLKSLGKLVQKPLHGPTTKYSSFSLGQHPNQPTPVSHWTLLSRDVLPDSRNQSYSDQQQLVQHYAGYEVPTILDATVALFMEYIRNDNRLYSNKPWTFTRCQEKYKENYQLVVGGFAAGGLCVFICDYGGIIEYSGVGIQRRFYREKK